MPDYLVVFTTLVRDVDSPESAVTAGWVRIEQNWATPTVVAHEDWDALDEMLDILQQLPDEEGD